MALVKPRKKASVVSAYGSAPKGSSGVSKAVPFTGAPKKPAAPVTQPAAPAKPALAAAPKAAVAAPPASVQTGADRNNSNYQYGVGMGDVNSQLRSLAAQFGGAPKVTQYGYDPALNANGGYGDTQTSLDVAANQPGSTLEVLLRNLGLTKQNIDDTNAAQNTFFSSRRVGDLGSADSQYTGDVGAAKRAYDDAVNALINGPGGILAMRGTRNQNLSQADITDQQAAANTPPEAQATDPAAAPIDWAAVQAAFGGVPSISAGGSQAQATTGGPQLKKKPKKK